MSSPKEPDVGGGSPDTTPPGAATPDVIEDHVQKLLQESQAAFHSLPDELKQTVTEPLEAALARVAETYATLIARLERRSAEADGAETQELAEFRKAALVEVSGCLIDTVQRFDAGTIVGAAFTDRLGRLRKVAEAAPEYVAQTNDSPISNATPNEGTLGRDHRLRSRRRHGIGSWLKKMTLLARWIVRRNRDAAVIPAGSIPLRRLLCFHVDQRLASALLPLHESVQRALARRYGMLERSATEWAFAVLELEDAFGLEEIVPLTGYARKTIPEDAISLEDENGPSQSLKNITAAARRLVDDPVSLSLEGFTGDLQRTLEGAEADLWAGLANVDKPLAKAELGLARDSDTPAIRALAIRRQRWSAWHREVVNRISLNHSVIALRENLAKQATEILKDARAAALDPVLSEFASAMAWIDATSTKVHTAFAQIPQSDANSVAETLRAAIRDIEEQFERMFPDSVVRNAQSALTDIGDKQWEQLVETIATLPGELPVHGHMHEPAETIDPNRRPFFIDLREIATNAISPAWPDLLSEAAEPLRARITRVWSAAEKLKNVIDYNLGAAIDELLGTSKEQSLTARSRGADEPTGTPSQFDNANKLSMDALRRSAELVDEQRRSLNEPWSSLARTFDTEVHRDWTDLITQVRSDDLMSERWTGLRTRVFRLAERLWDQATELSGRWLTLARKRVSLAQRVVTRLVRRGRTAVGVAEVDEMATIIEDLRGAEFVRAALPLVYRRLFSFGELTESALLVGRGRDLVHVRRRFENWGAGKGPGSLVIRAPLGSGRTSLLEALQIKVFEGSTVHVLKLSERVANETEFSKTVSGLQCFAQDENLSIDQVGRHLTKPGSGSTVILIDNIEHLLLQAAGGTQTLQKVLTLMLRTDHAVFWVATVSDEAWRYVEKAVSSSPGSLGSYTLTDIDSQDKEDLILKRHHRSGMSLRFTTPKDATPLLKRRLRSAGTPERQQEILKEIYFDALHRHTENNITLALLYWLRSVEFQEDGDLVVVRPFEAISFQHLKPLDLERLFALKALILHNTLTAAELGKVLRTPVERCALIFETLLNLALIERVNVDDSVADHPIDTIADRFRLSRLVVHPVVQRLRNARVLY